MTAKTAGRAGFGLLHHPYPHHLRQDRSLPPPPRPPSLPHSVVDCISGDLGCKEVCINSCWDGTNDYNLVSLFALFLAVLLFSVCAMAASLPFDRGHAAPASSPCLDASVISSAKCCSRRMAFAKMVEMRTMAVAPWLSLTARLAKIA